ncbi:MAG: sulfatase-like hydrolase/transferase [Clostridia bacterium]|nr:sulfatase-like hydrolase/transferase [Clostridia bacterium]
MINFTLSSQAPAGRRLRSRLGITHSFSTILFFALSAVYFEILFKIFCGVPIFHMGTLIMMLVSVTLGGIIWFLSMLTKSAVANRIIGAVLLTAFSVPYLVEYFVYKAFKVFYDVNTLVGGAGDTLGGFGEDIKRLVLCFDGISKILLYLLPAILLLAIGPMLGLCRPLKISKRILGFCFSLEVYIVAVTLIACTAEFRKIHKDEYNFQTAVETFGFVHGVCLDMTLGDSGLENADFDNIPSMSDIQITPTGDSEDTSESTDAESDTPEIEEPPEIPHITNRNKPFPTGENAVDIDFSALSGNSAQTKLNAYVASLSPSNKNAYTGLFKGKNLIFISAEAFSHKAIDPELTPTLYRLATKGINFTDYYQPASAGTTGGEYQNIFGFLPMAGGKSFKNTAKQYNYYTMGSQLDRLGYYGKAYHNNDYKYYDRHLTHTNLGYSDGYMGYGNGMEKYVTKRWPQSDLEMIAGTLPEYIDKQPFNIYYMSVSGHGVYSRVGNSMSKKNWDKVAHLEGSEAVKGYYASQIELDLALEHLVAELENAGIADDTVICISSDHFPYGLEDAELAELYGSKPATTLERDTSRLILWCGELEKYDPIVVSSPTFSLDILPTLSNLFGTEFDSRLMVGRDVFSDAPALVFNTAYEWKTDYGTYAGGKFTPASEDIELPEDYVKNIKAIVSNKILFCKNAPANDYYGYLFKK